MAYKPLEDYGLIGNLETCPLVGRDGSIDWCCFPHLESESVFAAILDTEKGGHFSIQPTESFESKQEYVERTNVLQTIFRTEAGTAIVTDFMSPAGEDRPGGAYAPERAIYRKVECIDSAIEIGVKFAPRFDYARAEMSFELIDEGVVATGNGTRLSLSSPTQLQVTEDIAHASLSLTEDETAWFVVQYDTHQPVDPAACEDVLEQTVEYWREWEHQCEHEEDECLFAGPWHDLTVRSELVLKLLTNRETSAIAAAPTTSLPETVGGVRNWDYRFNWIRDAGLTVQALYQLGHIDEATGYFEWCLRQLQAGVDDSIRQPFYRPLYGLHGRNELDEEILTHLSGYRNSQPVRVGNKAREQHQHDIYGELMLTLHETSRHGETVPADQWDAIQSVVNHVCEVWDEPDMGIWEIRDDPRHFVHSKVMCWVALDRAIDIAVDRGFEAPLDTWRNHRASIRETVLERGFDEEMESFTQAFETDALDAATLRLPVIGFLSFDDPRIQGTIDAVLSELATDDGLVYRYKTSDGVEGEENPFVMCSFWLIDALTLSGRTEEAWDLFEGVLDYASPLGLFAEEIDPETGEQRGNFPQAFSHLGLINSALYLRDVMEEEPTALDPAPIGTSVTERGASD